MPRGIYEKVKGSGEWWVRYADGDGRLRREKVGAKSLALRVYHKRKADIAENRFFPPTAERKDRTIAEACDDFLARVEHTHRSFRNYQFNARVWRAEFGSKNLRDITPGDIERYVSKRRGQKLKPGSINRELAFLKRLYYLNIGDGYCEANPVSRVKMLKENNARIRFLSVEEEARLRAALPERYWHIIQFAIHTGLRRGEIEGLTWPNIKDEYVIIPRSKNGERRIVPLNEKAKQALASALPANSLNERVFWRPPLNEHFGERVFRVALKKADIKDFRFHDLRHTFASRLIMRGVDLRTVQELMGHKDIKMTLRYSHLSGEHQAEAVRRLDG